MHRYLSLTASKYATLNSTFPFLDVYSSCLFCFDRNSRNQPSSNHRTCQPCVSLQQRRWYWTDSIVHNTALTKGKILFTNIYLKKKRSPFLHSSALLESTCRASSVELATFPFQCSLDCMLFRWRYFVLENLPTFMIMLPLELMGDTAFTQKKFNETDVPISVIPCVCILLLFLYLLIQS